jgi:trehalose 2-sulfotransferase
MREPVIAPHPTDAAFDLPTFESCDFVYMIASTPRAGGTYLSKILWETGVLGRPAEYFNFHRTVFRLAARFGTETPKDYLTAVVRARTTANGVFAFKAHYDQLQFLLLTDLIKQFRQFKVIRMTRNDLIAEAVSFSRAIQTDGWTSSHPQSGSAPAYNVEHLNWCMDHLLKQKRGWGQFFDTHALDYLTIDYNDLVVNPSGVANRVIQALGYPTAPKQESKHPEMTRQADTLNDEWIARYRIDPNRIDLKS